MIEKRRRLEMSEEINHDRRSFLSIAAMALAAVPLGVSGSEFDQKLTAVKPKAITTFGPLKQIDAGVLNVGYAEAGQADGPPVILLHGWPYDVHSFAE